MSIQSCIRVIHARTSAIVDLVLVKDASDHSSISQRVRDFFSYGEGGRFIRNPFYNLAIGEGHFDRLARQL